MALRLLVFSDLLPELAATRRVLERLPEASLGWQPHAKSFTLGGLATHVATLGVWGVNLLRHDGLDLATLPPPQAPLATTAAVLARFDATTADVRAAFDGIADAALSETWTLRRGDVVMMQAPRAAAFRQMYLNHLVHHRAQLTVYLRMLEVPVPGLYGPSADER